MYKIEYYKIYTNISIKIKNLSKNIINQVPFEVNIGSGSESLEKEFKSQKVKCKYKNYRF